MSAVAASALLSGIIELLSLGEGSHRVVKELWQPLGEIHTARSRDLLQESAEPSWSQTLQPQPGPEMAAPRPTS